MVEQIDGVENLFKTIDAELDYVTLMVDSEFEKLRGSAERKQMGERKMPVVKPSEVLHRLSQIKTEYQHMVQEVENLRRAEKETMEFFRDNLAAACENLQKLQKQAGVEVTSKKPAELQKFESLFRNESPIPAASGQSEKSSGTDGEDVMSTPCRDYDYD